MLAEILSTIAWKSICSPRRMVTSTAGSRPNVTASDAPLPARGPTSRRRRGWCTRVQTVLGARHTAAQHDGGVAPGTCRLCVGPDPIESADGLRQQHGDVRACGVVRIGGGFEVHGGRAAASIAARDTAPARTARRRERACFQATFDSMPSDPIPTIRAWEMCPRGVFPGDPDPDPRGVAHADRSGDDAAVIATPSGSVVATTDTLVHGPDFRLAWSSGYDLGWKAAAVNLADVAAMGARPTALLVALAVPRELRLSFVERLADGFRDACASLAPGCAVVGGDLTVSDVLTVAVTALGDLEGRVAVTRSGARAGDVVAVPGSSGMPLAVSRCCSGGSETEMSPCRWIRPKLASGESAALAAQLRPAPPIGLGAVAATAGATAMMDVSDGLALDARRMAAASGVTIALDRFSSRRRPGTRAGGGEDHALLATFPEERCRRDSASSVRFGLAEKKTCSATTFLSTSPGGTLPGLGLGRRLIEPHGVLRLRGGFSPPHCGVAVALLANCSRFAAPKSGGVERRARSTTTTASADSSGASATRSAVMAVSSRS